jgi:hypothetical protein
VTSDVIKFIWLRISGDLLAKNSSGLFPRDAHRVK